jgi:predicted acyltransferase
MPTADRNPAIDVLRGLTLALMIAVNVSIAESYAQLQHALWHGLTLADVVFPTFLFVVGASLAFTLGGYEQRGEAALLHKVLRRSIAIFLCGYLLYWFPFFRFDVAGQIELRPLAETRIFGVLQRIALAYCCAALIVHYAGRRGAVVASLAALLGHWAILHFFGDYTLEGNAARRVDLWLLGAAHMYRGEGMAFDAEGVLGTMPAVVNVLAGYLATRHLREAGRRPETLLRLAVAGIVLVVAAVLWHGILPINKKLWTSSYVLCTTGIDLVVYAALVGIVDRWGARGWGGFFEVLGRNTLFIYLLSEVGNVVVVRTPVGESSLFMWLHRSVFAPWAGAANGALLYALAYLLCCWLVAWALDRRRIYIRL